MRPSSVIHVDVSKPANVTRMVLTGALPGGEIWSTGFWMIDTGVSSNGEASAQAEVITFTLNSSDASGAMRIVAANLWNNQVKWLKTLCYHYVAGGTSADFSGEWVLPTPRVGGLTNGLPNQCAAVLSLRTDLSGRRNRGRMYLPAQGAALQVDGQLQDTVAAAVADGWALAFTDINASDAGKIVVMSAVGSTATQVSLVRMDSRLDVQRSRANKQSVDSVANATVTL